MLSSEDTICIRSRGRRGSRPLRKEDGRAWFSLGSSRGRHPRSAGSEGPHIPDSLVLRGRDISSQVKFREDQQQVL